MLWIEKYRPEILADILGQEPVIHHLATLPLLKPFPTCSSPDRMGPGKVWRLNALQKRFTKTTGS